jgi:hypothetical protein
MKSLQHHHDIASTPTWRLHDITIQFPQHHHDIATTSTRRLHDITMTLPIALYYSADVFFNWSYQRASTGIIRLPNALQAPEYVEDYQNQQPLEGCGKAST